MLPNIELVIELLVESPKERTLQRMQFLLELPDGTIVNATVEDELLNRTEVIRVPIVAPPNMQVVAAFALLPGAQSGRSSTQRPVALASLD
jgi:hypothetical protein